ncbi:MAG: hypothetical protein LBV09_07310 [Deferribacteraceae bacterium]|nr:hypothetical protein [Deferribacteraceae bacterium]
MVSDVKKVTMYLPRELLERAIDSTGKGITETVRDALAEIIASNASAKIAQYRGKVQMTIDIDELREDR